MKFVLDSSALLAVLLVEPGREKVLAHLADATISAVNWAEVVTKLMRRKGSTDQVAAARRSVEGRIADFDRAQADKAGELVVVTEPFGLSLGDRACLALALSRNARVLTADRAWAGLDVGVGIEVIR